MKCISTSYILTEKWYHASHFAASAPMNWYYLKNLKSRSDLSNFTVSNVDFLTVEFRTFRVYPAFNNLTDTDIHLGNVGHDWCSCWLGLLHLLLLLFLGLLLLSGSLALLSDCSSSCIGSSLLGLFLLLVTSCSLTVTTGFLSFSGLHLGKFLLL